MIGFEKDSVASSVSKGFSVSDSSSSGSLSALHPVGLNRDSLAFSHFYECIGNEISWRTDDYEYILLEEEEERPKLHEHSWIYRRLFFLNSRSSFLLWFHCWLSIEFLVMALSRDNELFKSVHLETREDLFTVWSSLSSGSCQHLERLMDLIRLDLRDVSDKYRSDRLALSYGGGSYYDRSNLYEEHGSFRIDDNRVLELLERYQQNEDRYRSFFESVFPCSFKDFQQVLFLGSDEFDKFDYSPINLNLHREDLLDNTMGHFFRMKLVASCEIGCSLEFDKFVFNLNKVKNLCSERNSLLSSLAEKTLYILSMDSSSETLSSGDMFNLKKKSFDILFSQTHKNKKKDCKCIC